MSKVMFCAVLLLLGNPLFCGSICEDVHNEFTTRKTFIVEGEVVGRSELPDPKTAGYPDCFHTVTVESIDGRQSVLVLPVMFDRRMVESNILKCGDKIRATAISYHDAGGAIENTRLIDDAKLFDKQYFFAEKIVRLEKLTPGFKLPNIAENAASRKILDVDPEGEKIRRATMETDKAELQKQLREMGGYDTWHTRFKDCRTKLKRLPNQHKWIGDSYFALTADRYAFMAPPDFTSFVNTIKEWARWLKRRNIDLILVRFPFRGELIYDLFCDGYVDDPNWHRLKSMLLEQDIEVIDPLPLMKEKRFDYPLMYFYHVDNEVHPHWGAAEVVAKSIARRLARYEEYRKNNHRFTEKMMTLSLEEIFLYPDGNPRFPHDRYSQARQINTRDGKILKLGAVGHPVLLLTNSFGVPPCAAKGASLGQYVSYELGEQVDLFRQSAMNADMLLILLLKPKLLNNRRAVVAVFTHDCWVKAPRLLNIADMKAAPLHSYDLAKDVVWIKKPEAAICSADEIRIEKKAWHFLQFELTIPEHCLNEKKTLRIESENGFITKYIVEDGISKETIFFGCKTGNFAFVPIRAGAKKIDLSIETSVAKKFRYRIKAMDLVKTE